MPPPTTTFTLLPTTTDADLLALFAIPTSPPSPLDVADLAKRQTYVTVSVMKNATSTDDDTASTKSNKFPVAIAVPALIGGMVLALGAFGLWWWWTGKQKKERRAAWEARQRKKRKAAEQSARPSISSFSRVGAPSTASGGQKSPINEKGFVPPVPALPRTAAQQDPFKERGYGYSATPSPTSPHGPHGYEYGQVPAQGQGQGTYGAPEAGAFGYATQPSLDSGVQYGYDQYGQPIPQYGGDNGAAGYQGGTSHRRSMSNDSSNPSNPFGSNAYPAEKQSDPEPQSQASTSPTKEDPPRSASGKSSKRAVARMAVAESAAANASVDPAYRHQPKKPSPLALAAAERKAAEAAAEREQENERQRERERRRQSGGMEHLAPPIETSLPPYEGDQRGNGNGSRQVVSGEWGVALGSPNNDGQFDINRKPSNGAQAQAQRGYQEDPYLQQQRAKSGQYAYDPYEAYHGDDGEEDDDVYHRAAEGMGLGSGASTGAGAGTPKKSRWV